MKIRHLVHSCLLVEAGGRRLLIDPGSFSGDAVRGLGQDVLAGIDAVVLTHQHPDHVDRVLLDEVLRRATDAEVLAEPETAAQLAEDADGAAAVDPDRLRPFAAGDVHELPGRDGEEPLRIRAVGGRHAVIHPDIPQVGNSGLVLQAGGGPRLGVTGDSLEPLEEFHGIDVLAFAVVAPWSKMAETIDFLRAVRPRLALPVHEAVASAGGRAIYLRQSAGLAPAGTEVRDWPADGVVDVPPTDRELIEREDQVARALREVPRAPFLPADLRERAGENAPLPIGHGQTNSQPYTVETMLRLLDVHAGHRVLDLGAGSGWTTALLARLVGPGGQVIGVERVESLIAPAREAVAAVDEAGVAEIRLARPGVLGAPDDGPFDRILVSAEARRRPPELDAQLAEQGVMVIPVGREMRRVVRHGDQLRETGHGAFGFVPLIEDPS